MTDKERLVKLCLKGLAKNGLVDQPHQDRLKQEIIEIEAQNEYEYILGLVDKGLKYPQNQNNLLVYYALGIVPDFDISKAPATTMGEYPDIDVDYLSSIRDYLKNEWAPENFGRDYICSIGSYTTYGIKSSLIEMAKVHDEDRDTILALTTKLGLKDEDGNALTFDTALVEYPELKAYCDERPKVADAARRMLHRNKGMGKHAGGLIISSKPIHNLVPLVLSKDNGILSAWVEGLHGQDLGPVGLIKFDLLVVSGLQQANLACKLIKERHGIDYICSQPGLNRDWSDISYLNDPKAIEMANQGDLKGIFQYDSDGIRRLAKGSVTSFDDLAAFSALYRPGPMKTGMHDAYVKRKAGTEEYEVPPALESILGVTYGVMVFQEQVMQVLNIAGKVPLKDGYDVIKAISKKKIDKFAKYKDMFIKNGQEVLGYTEEQMVDFWNQIESFAGYGFNKSHSIAYTYISSRLLYLKAHYPEEFYCALLTVEKTTEKLKEYKLDARRFGRHVSVLPVDINRSKVNFDIDGDEIFYGLADLKGVGVEVANRIVENQPYKDFEDFLRKFGTDAKVVGPVIALELFEGDPKLHHKYYEYFKSWDKKHASRKKRYGEAKGKALEKLRKAIGFHVDDDDLSFEEDKFNNLMAQIQESCYDDEDIGPRNEAEAAINECLKIKKAYEKSCNHYEEEIAKDIIPSIHEFNPDNVEVQNFNLAEYDEHISIREKKHYGFLWNHPLESLKNYRGRTLQVFKDAIASEGLAVWGIDVQITRVCEKATKKAKKEEEELKKQGLKPPPLAPGEKRPGMFYTLDVEDASGEVGGVTVWADDFERFEEDFVEGNLVSLRVRPPHPPFPNFTLDSVPRHMRYKLPNKENDHRVVVLKRVKNG